MANNLNGPAIQGYQAMKNAECPFIFSSPYAIAWQAGKWLNDTGRSFPRNVSMSRGYHIRANDMLLKWLDNGSFERVN